ncbi:KH domain-containing, RNA-binding, signal transduction-associated protein 2 [Grus japonensis]|uniref:KH domain-containing, RNA-binding, signal transduction-associated protein 2 n=1 Tax=Grus japonensis TaxID=30415 RepID=A0ABC9WNK7_GRUJA
MAPDGLYSFGNPAPDTLEKGYDDGYGGEYDDPSYEAYDNSYATQTQSVPEYYDYGHGTSEEAYDSYVPPTQPISSLVPPLIILM